MTVVLKSLDDELEELTDYPDLTLFSVVENGSQRAEFRVRAAEILRKRGTRWAFHPEVNAILAPKISNNTQIYPFGDEIHEALEREFTSESMLFEAKKPENPALSAGFTTKSWGVSQDHFPNEFGDQNGDS